MKTSASLHLRPLLACLGLLLAAVTPARAEESTARSPLDEPLVIARGKLTRDGKTVTATLHNVLEVVRQRYPGINITVIGVDNVVIRDLTLQWGRYQGVTPDGQSTDKLNPPLQGVLTALSDAAGRKFEAVSSSGNDFLLRVPEHLRMIHTEVFNLSPFFPHLAKKRELERLLRDTEIQRAMMAKSRPDRAPEPGAGGPSLAEFNAEVARTDARIAALKEQLAEISKITVDASKLTAQINEVVVRTLFQLPAPGEPPEMQFHAGTNLLIVSGSEAAVDITRKVIAALAQNP